MCIHPYSETADVSSTMFRNATDVIVQAIKCKTDCELNVHVIQLSDAHTDDVLRSRSIVIS